MALVIYVALNFGSITAGTFVAFIAAVSSMINPAKRLTQVNEVIQASLAAAQSVFGLIDEPAEPDTGTIELKAVKGKIEYRDVRLRYPAAAMDALKGVSFTIEPGTDGRARRRLGWRQDQLRQLVAALLSGERGRDPARRRQS